MDFKKYFIIGCLSILLLAMLEDAVLAQTTNLPRGVYPNSPTEAVNGESLDTFTQLVACESKDIFREIVREQELSGSPDTVRVSWSSEARNLGTYGFSNSLEMVCTAPLVVGADGVPRPVYSCRYGGAVQMTIDGNPGALPAERNWSVDRIGEANGRPVLEGGTVSLTRNPNQTSARIIFRGAEAAALRAELQANGGFRISHMNEGQLTTVWMQYHYIGRTSVRIRNILFCNDMGTECNLSTEYIVFIPYMGDRERCGDEPVAPTN